MSKLEILENIKSNIENIKCKDCPYDELCDTLVDNGYEDLCNATDNLIEGER